MGTEPEQPEDSEFTKAVKQALTDDIDPAKSYPARRPLLAHYTSLPVLEKILISKEIWMSHPLLMNDREEMQAIIDAGAYRIATWPQLRSACGTQERYEHLIQSFNTTRHEYISFARHYTFAVCFAEHRLDDDDGTLSMWRGYGANGNGVALVFDTAKIDPAESNDSPLILSHVVYLDNLQRMDWIDRKLTQLTNLIRSHEPSLADLENASRLYFERLKVFGLFTKHKGFAEEVEWRFVYMGERDIEGKFKHLLTYLIGPNGPRPKLRIPFVDTTNIGNGGLTLDNLVHRIILGPTLNDKLSLLAVTKMIEQADANLLPRLRVSGIPFRSQQ